MYTHIYNIVVPIDACIWVTLLPLFACGGRVCVCVFVRSRVRVRVCVDALLCASTTARAADSNSLMDLCSLRFAGPLPRSVRSPSRQNTQSELHNEGEDVGRLPLLRPPLAALAVFEIITVLYGVPGLVCFYFWSCVCVCLLLGLLLMLGCVVCVFFFWWTSCTDIYFTWSDRRQPERADEASKGAERLGVIEMPILCTNTNAEAAAPSRPHLSAPFAERLWRALGSFTVQTSAHA